MDNMAFQRQVIERLTAIETTLKMQDYKGVAEKSNEAYELAKQNERDITKMQEKNKWYYTTVIGTVIIYLLNLLLNHIKI